MPTRPELSASPAFEALVLDTPFRDRIAVRVKAAPNAIFDALRLVTLQEMKLAWLLGEVRYLPARLTGHPPTGDSEKPFLQTLLEGGTLILLDDDPREIITGSAGMLHRVVDQAPVRFASREAFDAFSDPEHEKLLMSIRVQPTGHPNEQWLVLEHATRALSPEAARRFKPYWLFIKPTGAFVSRELLKAIGRRAETAQVRLKPDAFRN